MLIAVLVVYGQVETGEFEARHVEDVPLDLTSRNGSGPEAFGEVVQVYKATDDSHPTFGELALIYPKPRVNTVVTKTKGTLWALDRIAFRSILMRGRPLHDVVRRLRQINLFRSLTVAQTNLVAEEMRAVLFEPNQVVLHEGMTEPGFFLITSGRIESTTKIDRAARLELKTFDYFGEMALVRRRSIRCGVCEACYCGTDDHLLRLTDWIFCTANVLFERLNVPSASSSEKMHWNWLLVGYLSFWKRTSCVGHARREF